MVIAPVVLLVAHVCFLWCCAVVASLVRPQKRRQNICADKGHTRSHKFPSSLMGNHMFTTIIRESFEEDMLHVEPSGTIRNQKPLQNTRSGKPTNVSLGKTRPPNRQNHLTSSKPALPPNNHLTSCASSACSSVCSTRSAPVPGSVPALGEWDPHRGNRGLDQVSTGDGMRTAVEDVLLHSLVVYGRPDGEL